MRRWLSELSEPANRDLDVHGDLPKLSAQDERAAAEYIGVRWDEKAKQYVPLTAICPCCDREFLTDGKRKFCVFCESPASRPRPVLVVVVLLICFIALELYAILVGL